MSWRAQLREVVRRHVGIVLRSESDPNWSRFVETRIDSLGLSGPEAYVERLTREPARGPELSKLLDVVSNNHTWFFRDLEQLEALTRAIAGLARLRTGPIEIWCAGCSTGEEPYSIAILCERDNLDVRILATDINGEAMGVAEGRRYAPWALRRVPDALRATFFRPVDDAHELCSQAPSWVRFAWHNLITDSPPRPLGRDSWDVVVCRNVLIYFAPDEAARLVRRLSESVSNEGLLVLGAGDLVELPVDITSTKMSHRILVRRHPGATAGDTTSHPGTWPPPPLRDQAPEVPTPKVQLAAQPPPTNAKLAWLSPDEEPEDLETSVALAYLRLRTHNFEGALSALAAAERNDRLFPEIHYLAAVTLRKLGHMERAAKAASRALFLAPDFWQASFLLANIYRLLGRDRESRREFARSIRLIDGDADGPPPLHPALFLALTPNPSGARRVCEAQLT